MPRPRIWYNNSHMSRIRYDLVFGLGFACSCSESLRRAKLQLLSFPYDWITLALRSGVDYRHELRDRIGEIESEFGNWFLPDEFAFVRSDGQTGKDIYVSRRLNHVFNHDFPAGVPFAESLPAVQAKYRRRIRRLLELIRSSRRVLVVRIDRPDLPVATDVADCRAAVEALERKFAGTRFDFLQVSCEPGGVGLREETLDGHVTRWRLDYRDLRPGVENWRVNIPQLGELLRARFSVRDYRTRDERKAFNAARRAKRYAKLGARNFLEYQLRRLFRRQPQ